MPTLSRREQTAMRITLNAQRLAVECGYEHFTMEDLAGAADVSRRTLFNYFPGKLDAVLGTRPGLPENATSLFVAGGPHGDLLPDLGEVVCALLTVWGHMSRTEWSTMRECFVTNPRVLQAAISRFDELARTMNGFVQQREGWAADDPRSGVAVTVMKAVFASAIDQFVEGSNDPRTLDSIFRAHLDIARDLFSTP